MFSCTIKSTPTLVNQRQTPVRENLKKKYARLYSAVSESRQPQGRADNYTQDDQTYSQHLPLPPLLPIARRQCDTGQTTYSLHAFKFPALIKRSRISKKVRLFKIVIEQATCYLHADFGFNSDIHTWKISEKVDLKKTNKKKTTFLFLDVFHCFV